MKICAVICEFDPFHNGHKYLLERARKESGCDKVLCLMSGNFTQRGEIAVLNKYPRARHAVENGADIVLELPVAYAVAPAELFARGAVHILAGLPDVSHLAFGCESGTEEEFLSAGKFLNAEDKTFKTLLKEKLDEGESYIRARTFAALTLHPELEGLLSSPNNILGAEYCRALSREKSSILPLPVLRTGGGHNELELGGKFSSASAIRNALQKGELKAAKKSLPKGVYEDLKGAKETAFHEAVLCALFRADPKEVAGTADCSEGLENRLVGMARTNPVYTDVLKKTVTKRYTLARIRRILAQNFLKLDRETANGALSSPILPRVLAVKKEGAEELLSALGGRVIARKKDALDLKRGAEEILAADLRADDLYAALTGTFVNPYQMLFVE